MLCVNSTSSVRSLQLSCNSCSCLTRARELRKLSCKLSLVNSHQLLSTLMQLLFSFDWDTLELKKLSCKLSLANSHATVVFVRPAHKLSLANSHSCLSRTLRKATLPPSRTRTVTLSLMKPSPLSVKARTRTV